jgi:hypothetical protein
MITLAFVVTICVMFFGLTWHDKTSKRLSDQSDNIKRQTKEETYD